MRTIVEQTISDLDAIFEAELDRQDRKDRSRTAKKNNKTAVKKAVAKGRKKKRDDETLEQRQADVFTNEITDIPVPLQRQAEITPDRIGRPMQVTDNHRLVQPEVPSHLLDALSRPDRAGLRELRDIGRNEIAWRQLDDDKRDDRCGKNRHGADRGSIDDEPAE